MLTLAVNNKSNTNNFSNIFEELDAVNVEDKTYQS